MKNITIYESRSSRRAKYMDSYYSESPYSSSTAVGRGPRRRRSRRSLADERGGSSMMRTRSSHGAVPVVAYYPVEALNPAMRMPSQHAGLVRVGSQQQQQPVVVVNVAPQGSYQQYPCWWRAARERYFWHPWPFIVIIILPFFYYHFSRFTYSALLGNFRSFY